MSKFYNVRNGGDPSVPYGFLFGGPSMNLAPVTYVATAAGLQLTLSDINKYDLFNVAQTSAATDLIFLPTSAPVGTVISFVSVSAVKIKAVVGTGIGTNGGTDVQGITTVAGDLHEFTRTTATNWVVSKKVAAGTTTAPVAA
jgi:hypothetical protein